MAKYNWKESPKWLNTLIALDQVGNTLFNLAPWPFTWPGVGDPDKTVSYTLGKLKVKHQGKIPWRYPLAKGLAKILDIIDHNHCTNAYSNGT